MVVSTHANERGSNACDQTGDDPYGCSHGNRTVPGEPFYPAVADDRIDGRCMVGKLPKVHTAMSTMAAPGSTTNGTRMSKVADEPFGCDAIGPKPLVEGTPVSKALTATLAVAEWERCLRNEFTPSKNRHKPAVVDSGAALIQRKGDSFPCLIPEDSTQEEALRMALGLNPFERLLGNALSPAEQACVVYNCQNPDLTKRHRHRVIKQVEALSLKLNPAQIRLAGKLPHNAPARHLHIPLIYALSKYLDYPDSGLPYDLVHGMPIVGEIPLTSTLPMKETPSTMRLEDVKGAVRATNAKVMKSLSKPSKLILRQKCWDLSHEEFRKGWLSEPSLVTSFDLENLILSPRFCIAEHHGIQEPKFRLIDDLTKSNVNKAVQMSETYCPQGIDSFVALTRLQHTNGAADLQQWSVDFSHAYKTIALHPSSADAAHICFLNPVDNQPYKCRILVQPFGSRRAPANWGRVVTFLQFLARKLLSLIVGAYVDDVFCTEGRAIAKSGFWAFKRLCALLGFNTSDKKDQRPSTQMHLLGAEVTLFDYSIRTRATDERAIKLRGIIAEILENGFLTPSGASKLRGRLGFYSSLLMGRLGRGMMGPLIRRQYGVHATKLTPALKRNLLWWFNAIGALPARSIPMKLGTPVGAHSDAQGFGHIAARALLPNDVTVSLHLPLWFVDMTFDLEEESPIFVFELTAAILAACLVILQNDGEARSCVLCVDNKAALAALIKGSSSSELGTILVNLFWSLTARCPVIWWFEYVNTKANAADPPSRVCNAPSGVLCDRTSGPIPPEFTRIFSSWSALHRESILLSN